VFFPQCVTSVYEAGAGCELTRIVCVHDVHVFTSYLYRRNSKKMAGSSSRGSASKSKSSAASTSASSSAAGRTSNGSNSGVASSSLDSLGKSKAKNKQVALTPEEQVDQILDEAAEQDTEVATTSANKKKKANKKAKKGKQTSDEDDDIRSNGVNEEDEDDTVVATPLRRQNEVLSSRSKKSSSPKYSSPSSPIDPSSFISFFPSNSPEPGTNLQLYPKSKPSNSKNMYPSYPHPKIPRIVALSTYFGYALLIMVGHFRDFLNRWGIWRTVRIALTIHILSVRKVDV